MASAKVSESDKQRLFKAYESDEDYLQLADFLNINRETAKSIVYR